MTPLIQALKQQKHALYGECESLDHAYYHAKDLLCESHKHDIAEALDVYHNTLLEHVISIVEHATPEDFLLNLESLPKTDEVELLIKQQQQPQLERIYE